MLQCLDTGASITAGLSRSSTYNNPDTQHSSESRVDIKTQNYDCAPICRFTLAPDDVGGQGHHQQHPNRWLTLPPGSNSHHHGYSPSFRHGSRAVTASVVSRTWDVSPVKYGPFKKDRAYKICPWKSCLAFGLLIMIIDGMASIFWFLECKELHLNQPRL